MRYVPMVSGTLARRFALGVALLAVSPPGTFAWMARIEGSPLVNGGADALTLDSKGDVILGGQIQQRGQALSVLKLSGVDGTERWRLDVNGGAAFAVATDGDDDAVVGGFLHDDFAVVKVDGASGKPVWTYERGGADRDLDVARVVAVDAAGDVIAAGTIDDGVIGGADLVVVKLAGGTGSELWRYAVAGSSGDDDVPVVLAVDASGNPVVAGFIGDHQRDGRELLRPADAVHGRRPVPRRRAVFPSERHVPPRRQRRLRRDLVRRTHEPRHLHRDGERKLHGRHVVGLGGRVQRHLERLPLVVTDDLPAESELGVKRQMVGRDERGPAAVQ
jgi:hypothetical protein